MSRETLKLELMQRGFTPDQLENMAREDMIERVQEIRDSGTKSSHKPAKAKTKAIPAQWLQGSALNLPIAAESVSFVFGVYVLHHLPELGGVFRECARVLRDGCAAFVTACPRRAYQYSGRPSCFSAE